MTFELFSNLVGAFFTLSIFSFLYKDNPFYQMSEQLLVGISLGYGLVLTYERVFITYVWQPIVLKQQFILSDTRCLDDVVKELAEMGILPAGLYRNRDFRMPLIEVGPNCPEWRFDILFDPQTSGGLLFALAADQAEPCLARLHAAGVTEAAIVGEIVSSPAGRIIVE